jgi:hypothetical protein
VRTRAQAAAAETEESSSPERRETDHEKCLRFS